MSVVLDVLLALVATYVSLTNGLAAEIERVLPAHMTAPTADTELSGSRPDDTFPTLPSVFDEIRTIPDLLRESAEYQQSASVGTALIESTTRDPLAALVNVYCIYTTDDYIRTTTGTGFFVHPDGVIMTNAHIAQFLLLEETSAVGETECRIRTGDPAAPRYRAELLYLPPAWLTEHAELIDAAVPMGTGERDYALLYVTDSITRTPVPVQFPALPISTELLPRTITGSDVVAAGYPAAGFARQSSLSPERATATISELYTFGSNYADVFSITGSAVGAEGSSGGPVVTPDGTVIGMIATRGDDTIDGPGSLRAITLSHIHRTILEETGFTLRETMSGDITRRGAIFRETVSPFLLTLLTRELQN